MGNSALRHAAVGMAALAAALVGVAANPAEVSAQTTWKMHIVWVPARPEAQAYKRFADTVNEKAAGKLKIDLHQGGTLGVKDVDMLRILPAGNVIQIAGLYPGYMTRDVPEYASTLPPGVVKEPAKMVDGLPALTKIYEETYKKWGIELLGYVMHPTRDTHILCKEPVSSLAQLKGKKLRVWEKFHVDTFAELGVSAQIVGQNDLYVAMKTGVVDCAVYPIGFATTVSLQEVAPNASYLFPYVLHPLHIIVSKKAYDALPADVRKIVADAAQATQKETITNYLSGNYDREAAKLFVEKGGKELPPFPDADQSAFTKTAREIWEKTAKGLGAKATENYEAVLKGVGG
ncbi:C4-dicarboxylate ABC transporter [Allostella vacuolata]|nr:C4-dicarboxylate ABC transporter [Stella vacuolata]